MEDHAAQAPTPWSTIRAQLAEGDLENARTLLQECLHGHPQEPDTWLCEAAYRLQMEEWDAAEMAIGQASMLAPASSEVALLDAQYCRLTNNTEGALARAHDAITYAHTQRERERAQLALAAHTLSHLAATKALADDEEDDWSGSEYADDTESPNHYVEEAISALKALLQANPDSLVALQQSAALYESIEAYEDALEIWEDAEKLAPKDPDTLHGLGRNLERLGYQEDAYETYLALFAAEQAPASSAAGLRFPPTHFQESANQAWERLFADWSLDAQPVRFDFNNAIYPDEKMLDESSPNDLFDPRVGLHVAFVPNFGGDLPVVLLILYQRNIERDLEGDDETSLALAIEDLLEQCVSQIFAILEEDPDDEW